MKYAIKITPEIKMRLKSQLNKKAPYISGMPMKIGVMGGAAGVFEKDHLHKGHELGESIAKKGCVLITGGCPGLPLQAACGAKQHNGVVVGISPGLSLDEHVNKYHAPTQYHDILIYTGSGLMGREVVNIRSSDIVVFIGGRTGTLGELAIAYDEGKLIGILTGTGGISDLAKGILKVCKKDTGSRVIYSSDPNRLIEKLIDTYQKKHCRKPSYFDSANICGVMNRSQPGMILDPVCRMWIDRKRAVAKKRYRGRDYVFCSRGCAVKFKENPLLYVSRAVERAPG